MHPPDRREPHHTFPAEIFGVRTTGARRTAGDTGQRERLRGIRKGSSRRRRNGRAPPRDAGKGCSRCARSNSLPQQYGAGREGSLTGFKGGLGPLHLQATFPSSTLSVGVGRGSQEVNPPCDSRTIVGTDKLVGRSVRTSGTGMLVGRRARTADYNALRGSEKGAEGIGEE